MTRQDSAPPVVTNSKFGFYQLEPIAKPDELAEFYESQYYDLVRNEGRDRPGALRHHPRQQTVINEPSVTGFFQEN